VFSSLFPIACAISFSFGAIGFDLKDAIDRHCDIIRLKQAVKRESPSNEDVIDIYG